MHHEINDSRAKWVDKLTDKSPTIKCKIIHWKMRKSGKADKGGWILATASLKVQNLPRRRHFLTQSTEVDEQNSLISWKITSRHDFEEFHNQMEEKHGGLDPESGLGGSKVQPGCGAAAEPDFFRALVLCLASSLAPPSSDGHGQHWPLDEAFILTKRQERERGFAAQRWYRARQPRWRWHNGARGAGIHNTPRGIHVCVDARQEKEGRWRVWKLPTRKCGADATN